MLLNALFDFNHRGGIRQASIFALTTCEVQVISRRDLYTLLADYPKIADELKDVALQCAEANEKIISARDIVAIQYESKSGKLKAIKMNGGDNV